MSLAETTRRLSLLLHYNEIGVYRQSGVNGHHINIEPGFQGMV